MSQATDDLRRFPLSQCGAAIVQILRAAPPLIDCDAYLNYLWRHFSERTTISQLQQTCVATESQALLAALWDPLAKLCLKYSTVSISSIITNASHLNLQRGHFRLTIGRRTSKERVNPVKGKQVTSSDTASSTTPLGEVIKLLAGVLTSAFIRQPDMDVSKVLATLRHSDRGVRHAMVTNLEVWCLYIVFTRLIQQNLAYEGDQSENSAKRYVAQLRVSLDALSRMY